MGQHVEDGKKSRGGKNVERSCGKPTAVAATAQANFTGIASNYP
jgi:hypothetical protein